MKRKLLWILIVVAVLALLGIIAAVVLLRPPADRPIDAAIKGDAKRGAYLALVGDCAACHSASGEPPFAGGLPLQSPIGTIYTTNITPDRETGIGDYSMQDFQRAVRQGVTKKGEPLYPAMPYPSFAKVQDQDIADLYAHFMQNVPPVNKPNQKTDIPWPLDMRWPLFAWINAFSPDKVYQPDPSKDAVWNRGAYLVQGLEHCGTCHTPRGIAMEEKGLDQTSDHFLAGGELEDWHAPRLHGMSSHSAAFWSHRDLVDFLKTGRNEHSAVFGSMTDVVQESTQHLTDEDLGAIATYLFSLNPGMRANDVPLPVPQTPDATTAALRQGNDSAPGAAVYLDSCAACHRTDGMGYDRTFPRLAGNSSVLLDDPGNIIRIVLDGNIMPSTAAAPTRLAMPDFAWRLNDEEVAQLLTFVRGSWGNDAAAVSAGEVAGMRKKWVKDPPPTSQKASPTGEDDPLPIRDTP